MRLYELLLAIPGMVALATASALPVENAASDNCQDNLGNCYGNGCAGVFENPNDTVGQCTAGTWKGCPCEKCGGGNGRVLDYSDKFAISFAASFIRASHSKRMIFIVHFLRAVVDGIIAQSRDCKS
ncbi:hypothetical protein ASPSYDRAFT_71459 [Aspergillus sydowii CBS 593.65]|uniref:Uncharacterized protein n=1 Tax=Aspergillus sydowii CBS 593.65 TaxID=1036612 RepID=A0A1L9T691_9EURO|nr:uncharacterized protein ASPSYDRAFT_71459 [Aspergillus sydowii CBS 593.65]OJJ54881.1 hypothetical protein ASPSYDRAFT_71459 [Aspergillus sydowii CBS 593.65]